MAINCEFINIIVRVSDVRKYYPGGLENFKLHFERSLGQTIWHDPYLLRDGAMNMQDAKFVEGAWKKLGMEPCIVSSLIETHAACDWLTLDYNKQFVYLTGTEPGEIAGQTRRGFKSCIEW